MHTDWEFDFLHYLSNAEAICVSFAFQDCLDKLNILGRIMPVPMVTGHRSPTATPQSKEYEDSAPESVKLKGVKSQHELFPKDLINSINPVITFEEDYYKLQRDRTYIDDILSDTLSEIQVNNKYNSLLHAVAHEKKKRAEQEHIIKREEDNKRTIKQLQMELIDIKKQIELERKRCIEAEEYFRDQLFESKVQTGMEERYVVKQTESYIEQGQRKFHMQEEGLLKRIENLKNKIRDEDRINAEMETFLKQTLTNLELKMEYWMDKYEQDTEAMDKDIETLKADKQFNHDLNLETERKLVEWWQVIIEYREEKERERKELEAMKKREVAALTLQSWWRGIMVRLYLGPFLYLKKLKMAKAKAGKKKK